MGKSFKDAQEALAAGGDSIRRLKIEAPSSGGTTKKRIRIVRNVFEDAWCHFFPGFKENGESGVRFAICLGKGKCPVCAKHEETGDNDYKAKKYFFMNVVDRKAEKPQVLLYQVGFGIFKDLSALTDEDSGLEDPSEFDIVISRTGSKKNDTRYNVKPFMKEGSVVKKKLPSEIRDLLKLKPEDGGPYDLSEFVKKKSAQELEEMLTGEFASKSKKKKKDDDDDEDEEPKSKKKKYVEDDDDEDDEPKKKKKKDDDDDDEDEEPKKKKKKSSDDDDEDEDDEPKKKKKSSDEDEDDEDDEPKKKKKKSDDDDDDDEDDEPKKKKKKKDDDDEDDD